jgi:tetratricopeptide (TPR) repeat protein
MRLTVNWRAFAIILATLAASAGTSRGANAQERPHASELTRQAEAKQLFGQGRIAYDLGNYDEAITKFQAAYEHLQEPLFLFNIAQSYRLKNDCLHAIDAYRRFIRLSQPSETREAAVGHLADLSGACAPPPATEPAPPLPAVKDPTLVDSPAPTNMLANTNVDPNERQNKSTMRTVSLASIGSGAVIGAVAMGLGVWNWNQHTQWSQENERLANPPPLSDPSVLINRQNENDDRLSDIQRRETLVWGLAVGAAVLVIAGFVVKIVEKT